MPTIWKEVLELTEVQEVMLPQGATILCAREQHERICIWFSCDPEAPKEARVIDIAGTGHAAPGDASKYIGTASLSSGQFIFHVFERVW